jgi:hypothetical protein
MSVTPRRIARAFPVVGGFFAFLAIVTAVIGSHHQTNNNPAGNTQTNSFLAAPYFWVCCLALMALLFQTWVDYVKEWYKSTLALKYQDTFESLVVGKKRAMAAKIFKTSGKWNSEVEPILDIFEDLGFYVRVDEISRDVAHHHLYYWIRGYVQTAELYIKDYQRTDPTAYENCEFLLEAVSKVEARKLRVPVLKLRWDEKRIQEFIQFEIEEGMDNQQ